MVESAIENSPSEPNMYTTVLRIARQCDDQEMVTRLTGIPNGDLVAVEARYHRKKACYLKYKKKLCALPSTDISSDNAKLICETVTKLMSEYYSQIIDDKQLTESYRSQYLKRQLTKKYPALCFISQPGSSDLVCSSELNKQLRDAESQDETSGDFIVGTTDESVIHAAVGILRKQISTITMDQ